MLQRLGKLCGIGLAPIIVGCGGLVDEGQLSSTGIGCIEQEVLQGTMSTSGVFNKAYGMQGKFFPLAIDPLFERQRHLSSIGMNSVVQELAGITLPSGPDVVVAVVDTGTDIDHPDLDGVLWQNSGETPNNSIDDDSNGYVDDYDGYNFASHISDPRPELLSHYHGTAVAGIAAAAVENGVGVSSVGNGRVKVMPLNVFGSSSFAATQSIVDAIDYAVANGADVINLSLGAYVEQSAVTAAIDNAVQAGVVVVAAAGNEGTKNAVGAVTYPARRATEILGFVSVAASVASTYRRAIYSSGGRIYAEIAAPGSDTPSGSDEYAIPDSYPEYFGLGLLTLGISTSSDPYLRMHGTSSASPVVAGAAALLISLYKNLSIPFTPETIELDLRQSGTQYYRLGKVSNGCRHLNVQNAVQRVLDKL